MHRVRLGSVASVAVVAVLVIAVTPAVAAASAPDLSISISGPAAVGTGASFTETATVANHGTAPVAGVSVTYTTGGPAITPGAWPAGAYCYPVQMGHSGRGGGVTTVGDNCWETLATPLGPGVSVTMPLTMTEGNAQTLSLSWSVAPYPAATQLNLVSHTAKTSVSVVRPPVAAAPTALHARESGDQLNVSWTPAAATAPYISNSVITATPIGGSTAPALKAVVAGAATSGAVQGVVASTTYSVTVANNDGGGAGPASTPISIKTAAASIVPGAPVITYAYGYAVIRWNPPTAGNSAIDQYEVTATGGGNQLVSYVSASTLADYLSPAPADSLAVTVRAHNAAGWGRWATPVYFADGGGG